MIRLPLLLVLIQINAVAVPRDQNGQTSAGSDTTIVRQYLLKAESFTGADPAKAQAYNDSALSLARKINDQKFIALALTSIGTALRINGEFKKAHEYFVQALNASSQMAPWLGDTYLEDGIHCYA